MKTTFVICFAVSIAVAGVGCGDDDSGGEADAEPIVLFDATPPDAAPPDAFVCTQTMCGAACVNLETDTAHCGECNNACTPASDCGGVGTGCECPENFVPENITTIFEQFDDSTLPPLTLGVGIGAGTDGSSHAFVAGAELGVAEIGVDIDLATSDSASFAVLYEFAGMTPRSLFFATAGTINFDRACADGMGGTVTNVTLAEASQGGLIPDGCVITVPSATFSYGSDCPASE